MNILYIITKGENPLLLKIIIKLTINLNKIKFELLIFFIFKTLAYDCELLTKNCSII